MELAVTLPGFTSQRLSVETAGFFRGARVLVNGSPVERKTGRHSVRNDAGEEIPIELKHNILDPIPRIKVGEDTIELARPLMWYEYLWLGIPIVLVFVGGALGAFVGILATYASARVFRGDRSTVVKYALTGLVSVAALVTFFVLATFAQILIGGVPQ